MWYIFPQFDGLGFSSMSKRYAIKTLAEAEAYLAHPILGPRLVECALAALGHRAGKTATEIFGSPDDMKLKSCATLFTCVSPEGSVFHRLLDKYFQGGRDEKTLELGQSRSSEGGFSSSDQGNAKCDGIEHSAASQMILFRQSQCECSSGANPSAIPSSPPLPFGRDGPARCDCEAMLELESTKARDFRREIRYLYKLNA